MHVVHARVNHAGALEHGYCFMHGIIDRNIDRNNSFRSTGG